MLSAHIQKLQVLRLPSTNPNLSRGDDDRFGLVMGQRIQRHRMHFFHMDKKLIKTFVNLLHTVVPDTKNFL